MAALEHLGASVAGFAVPSWAAEGKSRRRTAAGRDIVCPFVAQVNHAPVCEIKSREVAVIFQLRLLAVFFHLLAAVFSLRLVAVFFSEIEIMHCG